jgi:hypothetical protein
MTWTHVSAPSAKKADRQAWSHVAAKIPQIVLGPLPAMNSGLADGLRWIGAVERTNLPPSPQAHSQASSVDAKQRPARLGTVTSQAVRAAGPHEKTPCARHRQALGCLRGRRGCGFFGPPRRRLRRGACDQPKAREQPVCSHVAPSIHGRQTPSQLIRVGDAGLAGKQPPLPGEPPTTPASGAPTPSAGLQSQRQIPPAGVVALLRVAAVVQIRRAVPRSSRRPEHNWDSLHLQCCATGVDVAVRLRAGRAIVLPTECTAQKKCRLHEVAPAPVP